MIKWVVAILAMALILLYLVGRLSKRGSGNQVPPRRIVKSAKWYAPGESVTVKGYAIPGGLIYVGETLSGNSAYNTDASLINPNLPVSPAEAWEYGKVMGYWPSYDKIPAQCRGAYLNWLAGGRAEPKAYIGYVFLFFYGLERRLLIDGQKNLVPEQERQAIVEELKRLLQLYGENRSFRGYATNLLAAEWILYQRNTKLPDYIDIYDRYCSTSFEVFLARYVAAGKAIPASIALHWLTLHPDFGLRTPARRCEQEFRSLFFNRYGQKFGGGITIQSNKTPLKLDYHPASPSILGQLALPELNLPSVFNLKEPLNEIAKLAESCTTEFEDYSRYLGRKDSDPRSLTGLSLRPKEVLNSFPTVVKVKERLASLCANGYQLIAVTELYRTIGKELPTSLSKEDSETLALFLEKLDFGLAPDVRYHHISVNLESSVVIFPRGHGVDFKVSKAFKTLNTIIRLGAIVSQAYQKVSGAEKTLLTALINDNRNLTGIEKDSLSAFLHWCLNVPQNTSDLKQRLTKVNSAGKEVIRRLLVSLAHADGVIDPQKVKQLKELYTILDLDKAAPPADVPIPGPKNPIELNEELIELIKKETQDVGELLGPIFEDDKPEEKKPPEAPKDSSILDALDDAHQKFLRHLLTQETWERSGLHEFCKELGLMLDGAMETVNEWAFKNANALLIQDGEPICVDISLGKEILDGN